MANTLNRMNQGGSTWVVGGDLDVTGDIDLQAGAQILASSGSQIAMPVTKSTATDEGIPNYGLCIINSSGKTNDTRTVAAPTQAGLQVILRSVSGTTIGVNVCVASGTSLADIVMVDTSGNPETVWEIVGSTQELTMISGNTSQWFIQGPAAGTFSTDGST